MIDFESLAVAHKDAVYRQMIRACGNHEDAEDVLVEALLKAYQSLAQLQNSSNFRAWLAQIAKRLCWKVKEQEALRPVLQLSELEANGFEPSAGDIPIDTKLILAETEKTIKATIGNLPDRYRHVYELRDLRGLSGQEVAEQLGLSLAAQKSRLHRARMLIREGLDRDLNG